MTSPPIDHRRGRYRDEPRGPRQLQNYRKICSRLRTTCPAKTPTGEQTVSLNAGDEVNVTF